MKTLRPILVTGSHLSGTTWVGQMIAASPSVTYLYEPFNIRRPKTFGQANFDYWYTYVSAQNEDKYYRPLKNMIEFRYNLKRRWLHKRTLIKDPIALFSADWLSSRFQMVTVVLIRHPAAIAGSLKVNHWTHPFSHFLNQPLLMHDHLQPFRKEIERFANNEEDVIDQAALLWNLTHFMILKYKKNHPGWIFMRHEDLSRNPLEIFRSLFDQLNLDFSNPVIQTIKKHSYAQAINDAPSNTNSHILERNSLANIYTWKERLTKSEIERLKSQVQQISQEFYSEDEW